MNNAVPDLSRRRRPILAVFVAVVVVLCLALLWLVTSVQASLDGSRQQAQEQRQASRAIKDVVDDAILEDITVTAAGGGKSGGNVRVGVEGVLTGAAVNDAAAVHGQLRSLAEAYCFQRLFLHFPGEDSTHWPLLEVSANRPDRCAVIPPQATMTATYRQGRQLAVDRMRVTSPNDDNGVEATYDWFPDSAARAEDRIASWVRAEVPAGLKSLTLSVTDDIIQEEVTLAAGESFRPEEDPTEPEPRPDSVVTPDNQLQIAPGVGAGVAEHVRSVLDDVDPHLLDALAEEGVRILVSNAPLTRTPGLEGLRDAVGQVHTLHWSLPVEEVPHYYSVSGRAVYVNGLADEATVADRLLLALGGAVDRLLHHDGDRGDPAAPEPPTTELMEAERVAVLGPPTERELRSAATDWQGARRFDPSLPPFDEAAYTGYPGDYFAQVFALHHSPDPADREHLRQNGPRTHAYLVGLPTAMLELTAITGEELTVTWPAHPLAADYEVLVDGKTAGVTDRTRYTVEAPGFRDHVLQVVARDEDGQPLIESRQVDSATTVLDTEGVRAELDAVIYGDGPRYLVRDQIEQVEELLAAHRAGDVPDEERPGQNDFNRLLDEIRDTLAAES